MPRKRTPRGMYSSATARNRGFQAITYGQCKQVTTRTVAGGASAMGTWCSMPAVSGRANAGTESPSCRDVVAGMLLSLVMGGQRLSGRCSGQEDGAGVRAPANVHLLVNDPFKALSHPIRRGIVERL